MHTTALHGEHLAAGATMTEFGGWDMPLRYSSDLAEHHAVRTAAGLFDLSHMGEVWVTGPEAAAALDRALVSNMAAVKEGRAKYSLMCRPDGGIVDDLITYRFAPDVYLVVPNAGNAPTVAAELAARAQGLDARVTDVSDDTSMLALQGPNAQQILTRLVDEDAQEAVRELRYYAAMPATVAGIDVILARTGYTGEDGFELMVLPTGSAVDAETVAAGAHPRGEQAVALWRSLLAVGAEDGLVPAGLACRDTLRLEAGMPLYGNELTTETDPWTVGLGGVVRLDKVDEAAPVGRSALAEAKRAHDEGVPGRRVLVGLAGEGRRAARAGSPVFRGDAEVGVVTSGILSPTLGHPIALARVDRGHGNPGTDLEVHVRGRAQPMRVVPTPFYSRQR